MARDRYVGGECYFCGEPATCDEHAPPRAFFRGFNVTPITVPSCERHNVDKAQVDQAVLAVFGQSMETLQGRVNLSSDLERGLLRARKAFPHVNKVVQRTVLPATNAMNNPPEIAKIDIDLNPWVQQLTAAIFWSVMRRFEPSIDWSSVSSWSPNWLEFPEHGQQYSRIELLLHVRRNGKLLDRSNSTHWNDGWAEHVHSYPSDIYSFQFALDQDGIVFRHVFFRDYRWFSAVILSRELIAEFQHRVHSLNTRKA